MATRLFQQFHGTKYRTLQAQTHRSKYLVLLVRLPSFAQVLYAVEMSLNKFMRHQA